MPHHALRITTRVSLLALAYFITGRLGLMLPAAGSHITLLWLPTGIAVGSLLRRGFGCWPGVAIGAFAVNFSTGTPWYAALGIAVGNTLGPVLAARAIRRLGLHAAFDRKRDILILAACGVLGMSVSASLGVAVLSLAGLLPGGHVAMPWVTWWAGDTLGVVAAAPLVLAFTRKEWRSITLRRGEFLIWACVTFFLAWGVFVMNQGRDGRAWALAFVPLPMVAWAALRFGATGTSLSLILLSAGAAYGTATGRGPFHTADPIEGVVVLWSFMATSAVLGWLITALHFERVRATGLQSLFDEALSDVSLGIWIAGLDRRITYASAGFTRLTGYSEAELLGKSCAILQGTGTDPAVAEKLRAALQGDGYFDGEILSHRKDGTSFWNALLISPVRDEGGEVTGFLGIQRDITERKQAEIALGDSRSRLDSILNSMEEVIWSTTPDGLGLNFVSASVKALYGRSASEFMADPMKWMAMIHPEDREAVERAFQKIQEEGEFDAEYRIIRADGGVRWVHDRGRMVKDSRGRPLRQDGIVSDISERKRAEEALRQSEEKFAKAFRNSPDAVVLTTLDGKILEANAGFTRLTGYPFEEFHGRTTLELRFWADEADRDRFISALRQHGRVMELDAPFRTRNGDVRTCTISGELMDLGGEPAIVGIVRDITEQKQAESTRQELDRKMQETQKLESLGVLAGGIAHDFNNILTAILGNASLAITEVAPGTPVHECLDQIHQASLRAADLCRQMLAYSGRGRFVVRRIDLGQLIAETTHMLQISISKKAVLRVRPGMDLPPVEADPTQLRQVIMNLVINASEAIGDKGGMIDVSTGLAHVDRAYMAAALMPHELPDGDYVFLEVSDNGCGMSAETQARIFDPFYTTKFTGRGLGLAAVLGIVRGHKGAMKVYSELGRGSTFKLLFPVAPGPADAAMGASADFANWRGEGTILVVDDEQTVRSTVAQMLTAVGLQSVFGADGREGVELFRADPGRFALVLLDLTMPNMDGAEAFAEMRRLRADVPVVLMSGFNEQEALVRFAGKGIASFIQKPFALDSLRAVIRGVLG
jgi:PAS domain S-box-containing protein